MERIFVGHGGGGVGKIRLIRSKISVVPETDSRKSAEVPLTSRPTFSVIQCVPTHQRSYELNEHSFYSPIRCSVSRIVVSIYFLL